MKIDDRLVPEFYVIFSIGALMVAYVRLANPGEYPPGDCRAEPWFVVGSTAFLVGLATIFLLAAAWRLRRR